MAQLINREFGGLVDGTNDIARRRMGRPGYVPIKAARAGHPNVASNAHMATPISARRLISRSSRGKPFSFSTRLVRRCLLCPPHANFGSNMRMVAKNMRVAAKTKPASSHPSATIAVGINLPCAISSSEKLAIDSCAIEVCKGRSSAG